MAVFGHSVDHGLRVYGVLVDGCERCTGDAAVALDLIPPVVAEISRKISCPREQKVKKTD
ncbi:ribosome maturation factor RimP [Streptomyces sp. NBRC 110611]|nr:ribosome maturation factor RimP [Streptomyces sp. NBRC 110611]